MTKKKQMFDVQIPMTDLRMFAKLRWPDVIKTSLLGKVAWKITSTGDYESVIPTWLVDMTKQYNMVVLDADWRRNTYTLRFVPPNTVSTDGTGDIHGNQIFERGKTL